MNALLQRLKTSRDSLKTGETPTKTDARNLKTPSLATAEAKKELVKLSNMTTQLYETHVTELPYFQLRQVLKPLREAFYDIFGWKLNCFPKSVSEQSDSLPKDEEEEEEWESSRGIIEKKLGILTQLVHPGEIEEGNRAGVTIQKLREVFLAVDGLISTLVDTARSFEEMQTEKGDIEIEKEREGEEDSDAVWREMRENVRVVSYEMSMRVLERMNEQLVEVFLPIQKVMLQEVE